MIFSEVKDSVLFDSYVDKHPDGHPMQTYSWGEFKKSHGWTPRYFQVNDAHGICGSFVGLEKSKFGIRILYIPKGPLWSNDESREFIFSKIKQLAKEYFFVRISPASFNLSQNNAFQDILQNNGFMYSKNKQLQTKATIYIDINPAEEDILASFHTKTRYNVRLAEKRGVTVENLHVKDIDVFYELMQKMAKRQSYSLHNKDYFLDLFQNHSGIVDFFVARYEGKIIGTLVILHGSQKSFYLYGAFDNEYRKHMANYLLHWEVIKFAKNRGDKIYDLQGIPVDTSPEHPMYNFYKFKKGFSNKEIEFPGEYDFTNYKLFYKIWSLVSFDKNMFLIN